jgi:tRNA (mo5U34)-methyltransferase
LSLSDPATLAAEAERYRWFHSIDLGHGVVTRGVKSPAIHAIEAQRFFDPIDLQGRSVLDIGAWNGYYSFEAKRRGAARVVASDHFTWTHPDWRGRDAFELARRCVSLDVEAVEIDIPDLAPERLGTFDVVLFLGVFYHLFDPIHGLTNAARLANELLIVETDTWLVNVPSPTMRFVPGDEHGADPTNWWLPTPQCMLELLSGLGFSPIDVTYNPAVASRLVFHAWRSTSGRRPDPSASPMRNLPPMELPWDLVNHLSPRDKFNLGWRLWRRALRGR